MFDCFNETPDFTPYVSVKNQIPLDEMNPALTALTGKQLNYARLSMDKQFDGIDKGNDELFNKILWFSTMGNKPYPARFASNDE
jgi:hypothetical protein